MKKIIRIFFITIATIFLLLLILPILFKGKIETIVKDQINQSVNATVDWDRFTLSLFRGFPDLSINLHNVSVVGVDEFEGDTLVGLKRFEFRANLFSAIKKEVVVKSILLDQPLINGIVLEDGTANYDIVPVAESEFAEEAEKEEIPETEKEELEDDEEATGGSSMGIALKRFAIQDGRISYNDATMGMDAKIGDFDLELRGDFSIDQTELELLISINGIDAKYGGIRYMRDGSFGMDVIAAADMVSSIYTLKKSEIRINGLVLGAEGTVGMPEDGSIVTDIRFFTKETSFQTLLSMVPAVYLSDFESLKSSGSLALEGTVIGTMKDSLMPNATIELKVIDGFFSYPDLPKDVSDVQIALKVDYNGTDMDATTVDLEKFHLLFGGNPFDINLHVDHPFSDMHVAGMVKGMIDFASLKDVIPMEELDLSGRLDTDLRWDTRMSFIENEQFEQVELEGKLVIEGVHVNAPDIPVPVELKKLAIYFTPRYVNLETVDLLLGSSDLHMDGRLTNFIPYVFDDQTVHGSLNISSTLLDVNEFIPEAEEASSDEKGIPEEVLAEDKQEEIEIPENIDFIMTLDLKKILYDSIVIRDLTGSMEVKDGIANLDDLNMDVMEGNVAVSGVIDTRGEYTEADLELDLIGIDIPTSYETFVFIETLAPVARHCEGTANVEMKLFTLLDASFNPVYESINADGHLFARNLKVEQPASLELLGSVLKNEKLKNLELEKVDIRFAIRDGRVSVDPFDMNFGDSKITTSGSHGIDQTMDYILDMNIAKTDMGSGANELMSSVGALASGAGFAVPQSDFIKVKANITGTFKDPKVSTDLSGNITDTKAAVKTAVKEKVTEEVTEEVEIVKEQVREEVSEKADDLIKVAEEEKVKLIEQATITGDKLKKEAQIQGKKLIKEAGSNPIKKALAKKAAEELNKTAEKQAKKLVMEAEQKGDAIIEKAKEQAEKI